MKGKQKGFTLIELVVIIVILGILAAVAVPRYLGLTQSAADGTARGVLGSLRSANSLLFAQRVIGVTTAPYGWADVVGAAQIQGVQSTYDANYFTITVAGGGVFVLLYPEPDKPCGAYHTGYHLLPSGNDLVSEGVRLEPRSTSDGIVPTSRFRGVYPHHPCSFLSHLQVEGNEIRTMTPPICSLTSHGHVGNPSPPGSKLKS